MNSVISHCREQSFRKSGLESFLCDQQSPKLVCEMKQLASGQTT